MQTIRFNKMQLQGIHKRYDLNISFHESLTVLHGQNGTGKTTLIHIIANIANCDFIRFAFLDFQKIHTWFSDGTEIILTQTGKDISKKIHLTIKKGKGKSRSLNFTKQEALESIKQMEDDRIYAHIIDFVALPKKISQFCEENNVSMIETAYFPAFRTMLEAWASQRDHIDNRPSSRSSSKIKGATSFSRKLFGPFLPTINFPSPIDIEESLKDEIREAQMKIARYESYIFSDSFVKVFSALLDNKKPQADAETLLEEIFSLSAARAESKLGAHEEMSNTYTKLQFLVSESLKSTNLLANTTAGALSVYRDALKESKLVQEQAFSEIDRFLGIVNSFLDKKVLAYELDRNRRYPKVGLKFPDDSWSPIKVMSSGERQLLTMLYAVNKMSGNSAVLIDEPELSLHIDWQEELLSKMLEQLGDRQIIVCTHSPSIAADFEEYMKEVTPEFKDKGLEQLSLYEIDGDEDYL